MILSYVLTSRRIVRVCFVASLRQVHVAIGNSELKYPCFYGILMSKNRRRLISANRPPKGKFVRLSVLITDLIIDGFDWESIGLDTDAPNGVVCVYARR